MFENFFLLMTKPAFDTSFKNLLLHQLDPLVDDVLCSCNLSAWQRIC